MAATSWNRESKSVLETIKHMLDELPNQSEKCCIYRVPNLLRGLDPKAYTPMAIPIGPFHNQVHGQDSSQVDDPESISNRLYKIKYLKSFIGSDDHKLEVYLDLVKKNIHEIRECYAFSAKIFNDTDEMFTEMVLLDCVFIIQLFREHSRHWKDQSRSILMAPLKLKEIASDLLLAENQLPFFILDTLHYKMPLGSELGPKIPFIDIACEFLKINTSKVTENTRVPPSRAAHLLDMLRISLLPPVFQGNDDCFLKTSRKTKGIGLQKIMSLTATRLFEAGIKFEVNKDAYPAYSILDIRFHVEKRILYIPKLWVEHGEERKFRNLIAFEQSHTADFTYITDYQFFLDCLINTPADVQLLTDAGIIENWVGSEKILSQIVNSIGKHAYHFRGGYLYSGIAEKLNSYHEKKWYRYKAILKQVYFSHPWAIIPVCYAVVLLLLTILQVVVGILAMPPLNDKPRNN